MSAANTRRAIQLPAARLGAVAVGAAALGAGAVGALVLGLVGMLYVDQTPLSEGLKSLVRVTLLVAPILVSLGFFLSVLSPKAERPNGLMNLIYLGALSLTIGVVTLAIGLFQA
jgi:NADH:ubiquinone oxidoreductase subunit 6 (subunit J)